VTAHTQLVHRRELCDAVVVELSFRGDTQVAKIEEATLEEATRSPRTAGVAPRGLRFLTVQFFTILATVLGVYLAGYVGFQRNLEYGRLVKAQQKADLLMAVHEELKQNVARLRKFNDRLPADVGTGVTSTEWPHLRLFVWQAVGHSSSTFDMPPKILTDMQAIYGDIDEMFNDREIHDAFRSLTISNSFDRKRFKERLNEQITLAETAILHALESEIAISEQLVNKYSGQDGSR
jgi:hypothetical protein